MENLIISIQCFALFPLCYVDCVLCNVYYKSYMHFEYDIECTVIHFSSDFFCILY